MFGNRCGLDAILPNMDEPDGRYDPQWTFRLMTDRRYMKFNGTVDFLNYEPHGRFLYIGQARQCEHAWLVLVPRAQLGVHFNADTAISYKSIRPMDPRTVRAVFMMLAFMLSRINYSDIHITNPYPSLDSDKEISEYEDNIL